MISRRFILSIAIALFALAAIPSFASALTITVDDDRAQCPLADETSLTAAVAAAANGDTVKICAGTYNVPGGPAPSSGLRIEKNISLAGAGSDKVFVQPTQGSGSMAQASPNPRDEYGNVITVRRRLVELYDVSISGLTVRAGNVPVEAGIAMVDVVTGTLSSVKVEGIVPLSGSTPQPGTGAFAPEIEEGVPNPLSAHGHAVVVANTIEQTQNTTTITGSQFSQFNATGVLVDSRRLGGSGPVGNKSTVTAKIRNTRITGAGASSPVAQTGIEGWGSGAAIELTKSKIAGVGKADGSAAAVEMHGVDVVNSVIGGSEADRNDLTANAYGATNVAFDGSAAAGALKAGGNFWGTTVSGSPSLPLVGPDVDTEPTMPTAPPATTLAPIADSLPLVQWDTRPAEGAVIVPGGSIPLAVMASDDFGIKSVEFRFNGLTLGTSPTPSLLGERIYTGSWTPSAAFSGENTLSAVATDSNNQTSEVKVEVMVEGKPRFTAAPALAGALGGYAAVGKPLTCSPGTVAAYPLPTYTYSWSVAGSPVGTNSPTYTPTAADQGKRVLCSVKAENSHGSAAQASGQLLTATEPVFAAPAAISGGETATHAVLGDELTCSAGAASGEPAPTTAVAWARGEVDVGSGPAYTVSGADIGSTLTCTFTATSATGVATTSASVVAGAAPAGGVPVLSGDPIAGSQVSCDPGSWAGTPSPQLTYRWLLDAAPITEQTEPTYTTEASQVGAKLTCEVTATNELGSATATSAELTVAAAPDPPVEPTPPSEPGPPPAVPPSAEPPLAQPPVGRSAAFLALAAPGTVSGRLAPLAAIGCALGPCTVGGPKQVTVRIGGSTYKVKLVYPDAIVGGAGARVKVRLSKAAKAALARAGRSAKFTVKLTVAGSGASATRAFSLRLKAPQK